MRLAFLVSASLLLTHCSPAVKQPVNLGAAKIEVQEYYESGGFERECSAIIDDAINHFKQNPSESNSAVIFDIDETALSNYQYTKEIGFGYIHKSWKDWQQKSGAPAIQSVKRLYDYLISKSTHIVFLTGRDSEEREATERNLRHLGYNKFDTLIVRSEAERSLTAAAFKLEKRKELIDKGYKIAASVGDQLSDFFGGETGYKIMIPNYLYLID
ncbi:MAG: HAD family acid phosphatase [Melioribacteraceae bacterium]|jgi:acid phosphatase